MHITVTGLNHRTAPLATRETLSLSRAQLPQALDTLRQVLGRGVLLATCNRTEVYTVANESDDSQAALHSFIERQFGVEMADLEPHLYKYEHGGAVTHLYRVASSLDSLIIGESEVLGQVREAYSAATKEGTAGGVLAKMFHEALRVGKRVRTETAIGRNALSVSRACVEVARRAFGDLRHKQALVIGVGDAGRLAARALRDAGVSSLVIANRTMAHAQDLAEQMEAQVAPLEDLPSLLREADIVVSSTGAPDFMVTEQLVAGARAQRPERPLFLFDVAVPRDIDPAVAELAGVELYTMYDLEFVAETNRREREAEATKAEVIIQEEVARFQTWWDSLEARPTIAAMRRGAESVRAAEVERVLASLPELSAQGRRRIEAMSKALVKKVLHNPTRSLNERKEEAFVQVVRELFGLDQGVALSDDVPMSRGVSVQRTPGSLGEGSLAVSEPTHEVDAVEPSPERRSALNPKRQGPGE